MMIVVINVEFINGVICMYIIDVKNCGWKDGGVHVILSIKPERGK